MHAATWHIERLGPSTRGAGDAARDPAVPCGVCRGDTARRLCYQPFVRTLACGGRGCSCPIGAEGILERRRCSACRVASGCPCTRASSRSGLIFVPARLTLAMAQADDIECPSALSANSFDARKRQAPNTDDNPVMAARVSLGRRSFFDPVHRGERTSDAPSRQPVAGMVQKLVN